VLEQTLQSDRELHAGVRTAPILSVATELPPGRLTTGELAARLGVSERWIMTRTGIRERRRAAPTERLSDYATRAGRAALARAAVDPSELDLVLVATMTQDELTPNTAPLVATRITDFEDRRIAPLFADAAGAVVLGCTNGGGGSVGPIVLGCDGSHGGTITATHAERKLRMDGSEVFKHAVARMREVTLQAAAAARLSLEQIDLFVFHQANARIISALESRLGLDPQIVVNCIETLGNASAATLPVALARAQSEDRLRAGDRVLLSAFGAGFTWGGGVVRWGSAGG
jgi:3-oxoacyl-[acyl-carrier-protein] synthase III